MSAATDALTAAVAAEDAAVFAYGIAIAYAAPSRTSTIADYTAEHRARRDEMARLLTAAGGRAPEPGSGYVLPVAVTDPVSAIRVMVAAEQDCARAYRAVLERADQTDQRRAALEALTGCADRAARWRLVLRITPSTVALPGS